MFDRPVRTSSGEGLQRQWLANPTNLHVSANPRRVGLLAEIGLGNPNTTGGLRYRRCARVGSRHLRRGNLGWSWGTCALTICNDQM